MERFLAANVTVAMYGPPILQEAEFAEGAEPMYPQHRLDLAASAKAKEEHSQLAIDAAETD